MRRPNLAKLQKAVDDWNQSIKVGDEIEYYPLTDEPTCTRHKTRSEAIVLSGHTAVVWLEGRSGCVALDHCKRVPIGG